jgi:glutamine amidotransferase
MITIVNYGLGNLGSIQNILRKIGHESIIIDTPEQLDNATKIILPGVGAFDTGMKFLNERAWIAPLNSKVMDEKIPVLGICLGMQLMTKRSEEGVLPGLGWVDAETIRFSTDLKVRIPHMGWNVTNQKKQTNLIQNDVDEKRFYFVHSYFVKLNQVEDELLSTSYGAPFTSGFERENIIGVQFHPEKSHRFGKELLRNFAEKY